MYLWRTVYLNPLHIFIGLSFYCWIVRVLYIFWLLDRHHIYDLQMFSATLDCLHFLMYPLKQQGFKFWWSPKLFLWGIIQISKQLFSRHWWSRLYSGMLRWILSLYSVPGNLESSHSRVPACDGELPRFSGPLRWCERWWCSTFQGFSLPRS